MSNKNTARRALYLPPSLDDDIVVLATKTGKKPNAIIIEAIENFINGENKRDEAFEKRVVKIIEKYNKGVK